MEVHPLTAVKLRCHRSPSALHVLPTKEKVTASVTETNAVTQLRTNPSPTPQVAEGPLGIR